MKKKIKIGIDLDEVIRSKWLQFDRYYVEEFGEEGTPRKDDPYTLDFFGEYKWENQQHQEKYLKNPDEIPETINPLDYQVNEEGESNADFLLFREGEKTVLSPKEVFNRFMYEDYGFEIHGSAPLLWRNMDFEIDKFIKKYQDHIDMVILSRENVFSIPPTLFFLSKIKSKFKEYFFVEEFEEYWREDIDLIITTRPEVITKKPPKKDHILIERPYNMQTEDRGLINNIINITDLLSNKEFEKYINYEKSE